jgi:hypothetical protein
MKKLSSLLIAALVATCALAAFALASKPHHVKTDVTIKFTNTTAPGGGEYFNPYAEAKFHGKVSAKHDCNEKRKVLIKKQGGGTIGSDKTDDKGFYEVGVASNFEAGNYFATVKKRTVKKGHGTHREKFKCAKGTSNTITAP